MKPLFGRLFWDNSRLFLCHKSVCGFGWEIPCFFACGRCKHPCPYQEFILDNIEYDVLIQNERLDRDRLDELVELMLDTVCSHREMIRIAGDDHPAEVVKSRFLKLNSSHIEYVLDRMAENTTQVRNIKKYLLAALYNAPITMDSYYTSLVSHDLYGGERR